MTIICRTMVKYKGYELRKLADGRYHVGTVQNDGRWLEQGDRYGYGNCLTAKRACDGHFGRL